MQTKPESVFEIGGEGGSIKIERQQNKDGSGSDWFNN